MDYEEVVARFSDGGQDEPWHPDPGASAARQLRDAMEPLAAHAIWNRPTNERYAKLGLDFVDGYVYGRAGSLGTPPPDVVVAAFAVFDPERVGQAYERARRITTRDAVVRARIDGASASIEAILSDSDVSTSEIDDVVRLLIAGIDASAQAGRPLFAGLLGLDWPEDPYGRLCRAAELLREHRGDCHVAASISSGLDPATMDVLTRAWHGADAAAHGIPHGHPEAVLAAATERLEKLDLLADGTLTTTGRAFRDELEGVIDAMQAPIVEAIGPDLPDLIDVLTTWSQWCLDANAYPPDPMVRAIG